MTKEHILDITNILIGFLKQDEIIDDALINLCKAICPTNYPIFNEYSLVYGYIKGIRMFENNLADDLERYIYEMPYNGIIEKDGKEWKIKNIDDFEKYLIEMYVK